MGDVSEGVLLLNTSQIVFAMRWQTLPLFLKEYELHMTLRDVPHLDTADAEA